MATVSKDTYTERASEMANLPWFALVGEIVSLLKDQDEWKRHHRIAMVGARLLAEKLPDSAVEFQKALESAESAND